MVWYSYAYRSGSGPYYATGRNQCLNYQSPRPNVPMRETFKGVMPFLASGVVRVALLILLPPITLFLPHFLM